MNHDHHTHRHRRSLAHLRLRENQARRAGIAEQQGRTPGEVQESGLSLAYAAAGLLTGLVGFALITWVAS